MAQDDLVALHSFQRWPGNEDYAGIDILRLWPQRAIGGGELARRIPAPRAPQALA